ncbi:hypothetical protein SVAN01_04982 [Stagonosporopsis vannaccii]|nr:hypothetical protein SVAN01_04982 [Stagonosporopsis vannaccii]
MGRPYITRVNAVAYEHSFTLPLFDHARPARWQSAWVAASSRLPVRKEAYENTRDSASMARTELAAPVKSRT